MTEEKFGVFEITVKTEMGVEKMERGRVKVRGTMHNAKTIFIAYCRCRWKCSVISTWCQHCRILKSERESW